MKNPITVYLLRTYQDTCTESILLMLKENKLCYECRVLELPDKNNQPGISCIPEGEYDVTPYTSVKFKQCFAVNKVPGRSAILIHAGNTVDDTRGCLLPGHYNGLGNVSDSRKTLSDLRKLAPKGFILHIYDLKKLADESKS